MSTTQRQPVRYRIIQDMVGDLLARYFTGTVAAEIKASVKEYEPTPFISSLGRFGAYQWRRTCRAMQRKKKSNRLHVSRRVRAKHKN